MSREKSTVGSKVPNTRGKVTISRDVLKVRIAAIAIVAIALGSGATLAVDELKTEIADYQATRPYDQVVSDNTYRTADNQGYFYRNSDIAQDLEEQFGEDIKMDIYGTYKNMNANATSNMNEVVKELLGITFEEYLIQEGFTDEEGHIDLEAYEDYMEDYIMLNQKRGGSKWLKEKL